MIDRDAKELLEIAASLAAIGTLALEVARYIESRAGEQKGKRPQNRIRRRKHKR